MLAVPVAFGVDRVIHRDGLRMAIGVLAAVVALGVSLTVDSWVTANGMRDLAWYLTWKRHGGWFPGPAHIDITPVIAFVTAVRLGGRTRWQLVTWAVDRPGRGRLADAGAITPLAIVTTYVIGRAVGYGTLYAVGSPNTRPTGRAVMAALRRVGLDPVRASPARADGPDDSRSYTAALADGRDHRRDRPRPRPAERRPDLPAVAARTAARRRHHGGRSARCAARWSRSR